MDWTPDAVERLTTLWAEGQSSTAIGRRMGIGKNAVVGKARRLGLPARPSPIRGANPAVTPRRLLAPRHVAPTQAVSVLVPAVLMPSPVRPLVIAIPVRRAESPALPHRCCWPFGYPRAPDFRFCDRPIESLPYCEEHRRIAYVPRHVLEHQA